MALIESSMLDLGSPIPNTTSLEITNGLNLSLPKKGLMAIAVICNHCPFVVHIAEKLAEVFNALEQQGIVCLAVSANDVIHYPQDAPEKMNEFAQKYGFNFPYAYDDSQEFAKALKAECTPDFYIFDAEKGLIYRGEFCPSRPNNGIPVTGKSLLNAIDAHGANTIISEQKPSIGCSIKWK